MNYALARGFTPNAVMKGSKFFQVQWRNVTLRDFCCLLPSKLADLPKALGFTDLLGDAGGKTWFPWRFANKETLHYVGEVPDRKFFAPELMTGEDRRGKFEEFYFALQQEGQYDFRAQAAKYCFIDTQILALALQRVKKVSLDISNGMCDQIVGKDFTLPGFTMTMFRNCFMEPNSIGIMGLVNYGSAGRRQSSLAVGYLEYLNKQRRPSHQIRHAANFPMEKHVTFWDGSGTFLDGWDEREKQGYEIDGVWYKSFLFVLYKNHKGFLFLVLLSRPLRLRR